MTAAVVRPRSLVFVAAAIVFALALAAWAWSYAATSYLDQGRLLVISGNSGDIVDATYAEDDIHNREEAHLRLSRADGWYALRDVARRAQVVGSYHEPFGGFGLGQLTSPNTGIIRLIAVPLWSIAAPTGLVVVGLTVGSTRARRRAADNRCATCGYDLRGSAGRCPECGTLPVV